MGKYDLSENPDPLYNRTVYKFPTRTVASSNPNHIWSVDLVDMATKPDHQQRYIFNMVDVFSRKLFSYPMSSKTQESITKTLKKAFAEHGTPQKLWSDKESGLLANSTMDYLNSVNVSVYHTYGRTKSSIVESLNRTQKTAIEKMTKGKTMWLQHVKPFEKKYNSVEHSSIHTTPNMAFSPKTCDAEHKGVAMTCNMLNAASGKSDVAKFAVGDKVRAQRKKDTFDKGYKQRWTNTIFTVHSIKTRNPTTYTLKDSEGTIINVGFYNQELQKV